jgi:hypothetical protein
MLTKQGRIERKAAVRADRCRGFTFRKLAKFHGISVGLAHYLARNVQVMLPNAWHRARHPKETPLPYLPQIHALLI